MFDQYLTDDVKFDQFLTNPGAPESRSVDGLRALDRLVPSRLFDQSFDHLFDRGSNLAVAVNAAGGYEQSPSIGNLTII